jgi:hypothetical protein
MAELSTTASFIVRIYRFDTNDTKNIVGMIEPIDGRGLTEAFTNIDELGKVIKDLINTTNIATK